jgi:hypothetical protein
VASDPLIWEQHPNNDRHQAAVFREFFREALASGGALVVSEAGTGRLIGSSRFHAYDPGAARWRSAGPSWPDRTGAAGTTRR